MSKSSKVHSSVKSSIKSFSSSKKKTSLSNKSKKRRAKDKSISGVSKFKQRDGGSTRREKYSEMSFTNQSNLEGKTDSKLTREGSKQLIKRIQAGASVRRFQTPTAVTPSVISD